MDTGSTKALLEWDVGGQAIVTVCGRNLLNKPIYRSLCQLMVPSLKPVTIGLSFFLLLSLEKL